VPDSHLGEATDETSQSYSYVRLFDEVTETFSVIDLSDRCRENPSHLLP
jgi:hypothetical protein